MRSGICEPFVSIANVSSDAARFPSPLRGGVRGGGSHIRESETRERPDIAASEGIPIRTEKVMLNIVAALHSPTPIPSPQGGGEIQRCSGGQLQ
jgi:hypothetical protein